MQISKFSKPFFELRDTSLVKLTECGNIFEVMCTLRKSKGSDVRKLSNDTYYRLRDRVIINNSDKLCECGFSVSDSGEIVNIDDTHILKIDNGYPSAFPIKYYKTTTNRFQSPNELRRTFHKIRNIINCNVTEIERCKFCTLTYAENMTDTKKLCEDFRKFNQRFKRYVKSKFDMTYEYIAIAEPQSRGAWHMHIIYIFNGNAPYIHFSDYARIWGLGSVDLSAFNDVDNVGAYFSAYLSNLAVNDEFESNFDLSDKQISHKNCKRFIKGGRLVMYPTKFNILRTSRRIKRPVAGEMSYEDAKKIISSHIPKVSSNKKTLDDFCTFRNCIEIHIKDNKDFHNTICYEYYNVTRKGKNKAFKPIKEVIKELPQQSLYDYEDYQYEHYFDSLSNKLIYDYAMSELKKCADMGYTDIYKKLDLFTLNGIKNFTPKKVNEICNQMIDYDIKVCNIVKLS